MRFGRRERDPIDRDDIPTVQLVWTLDRVKPGKKLAEAAARSDTARSLADIEYDIGRHDRPRMHKVGNDVVVRVHGLE
jgi:hypothetical protein